MIPITTNIPSGSITIELTPLQSGIAADGGTLDLLIRVQAPTQPSVRNERSAMHLALVIDRSGSMAGQPLQEAVRCAEYIINHLSQRDRAAVVVYDTNVQTLVPLLPVEDKRPFIQALRGITDGGSTALHAGWLAGAQCLAPHASSTPLSRVLLLSDGQANVGETDVSRISAECKALAGAGVTTTTIGLGRSFNEDLMVNMARQGGGQHYYGQTAEDLQDAFKEEFDLLQALFVRQLTATLLPGPGVVVEVLSVPGVNAATPVALSDLAFGAEVWLLVRLHYSAKTPGTHSLLSVQVKGERIAGGAFMSKPALLELPALPSSILQTLPISDLVKRRQTEVHTANLYDGVRSALLRHDRQEAEALIGQAKAESVDSPWMEQSTVALRSLMDQDEALAAKEALFQSEKARRRQAPIHETAAPAPSADLPAFLRRKTESGKKE